MIPAYISKRIYSVRGTECRIWLGSYTSSGFRCEYEHRDGNAADAREVLYGNPRRHGFWFVMPTCENGRCLAAGHQVVRAFKSIEEATNGA